MEVYGCSIICVSGSKPTVLKVAWTDAWKIHHLGNLSSFLCLWLMVLFVQEYLEIWNHNVVVELRGTYRSYMSMAYYAFSTRKTSRQVTSLMKAHQKKISQREPKEKPESRSLLLALPFHYPLKRCAPFESPAITRV